jgi:predicted RNA-binding Zn-ribbon protein involved in translation (DUF1610 family)
MKIEETLIVQIMKVLIHNVGDHRICPKCGNSSILKDACTEESWMIYQELEKLLKEKK